MRAVLLLALSGALLAQETAPARAWTNVTTLSYVATSGNAEGQTFGLANDFNRKWNLASLALKLGMIRAASTTVSRSASGVSLDQAVVTEQRVRNVTAESYVVSGRYDYRLKEQDRFYWYAGLGWERNRPSGLNARETATLGLGYIWVDGPRTKFRSDAGVGSTHEEPLVLQPGFRQNYGTFNVTSTLKQKFNAGVDYGADLAFTANLRDRADRQTTFKQALTVAMTKRVGLKVGLDLAYRSQPNLIPIEVFSLDLPPVSLGKISVPAKKLDTITTTSLVITF